MRLYRNRAKLEGVGSENGAIGPSQADQILRELNKGETDDPQEALERGREARRNIVHAQGCVRVHHRGDKESFYSRPTRAHAREGLGHRNRAKLEGVLLREQAIVASFNATKLPLQPHWRVRRGLVELVASFNGTKLPLQPDL